MAEVIGTAASIIALVGTVSTLIQEVRSVRDRVRGASKTFDDISGQLDGLERSLNLVREEERLQTAGVEQQVEAINKVALELRAFLVRLASVTQQRGSFSQVVYMFKSGDKNDKQLEDITRRLDREKTQLILRISVVQVGLFGNLKDGFRVAFNVLQETNTRVKEMLGINLRLAERLTARHPQQPADGIILLDKSDAESLGLTEQQFVAATDTASVDADETSIYDNITLGQARIMTGDVGVEGWLRTARRKTTIAHNRFGQDVRIMTGDQGGEAAKSFNANFWG
ncbi:hypothetical protein NKR23_g9032 [Pleurostoma richardsiae]|uniref:Fungal N-terminal domain-containing protein n=1 Tax=Pleurostoma richardsiae TaxID=41990 RepID=A0AA38RGW2_9PEZI|nr:hypothetical protein NKR23_g9032 [Pleurostoma richardsiae]